MAERGAKALGRGRDGMGSGGSGMASATRGIEHVWAVRCPICCLQVKRVGTASEAREDGTSQMGDEDCGKGQHFSATEDV